MVEIVSALLPRNVPKRLRRHGSGYGKTCLRHISRLGPKVSFARISVSRERGLQSVPWSKSQQELPLNSLKNWYFVAAGIARSFLGSGATPQIKDIPQFDVVLVCGASGVALVEPFANPRS